MPLKKSLKSPAKQAVALTPGEAELLRLFWEHGPLTLSQTHDIYTAGSGSPALQTIQTRLNRMVAKQLLRREGSFPAVYSSAICKEKSRGAFFDLVGELVENLAGDDLAPLMLHLVGKRTLTPEEIDALETIVQQQRAKTKHKER